MNFNRTPNQLHKRHFSTSLVLPCGPWLLVEERPGLPHARRSKESQYFAPSRCPLTRAALSALIRSRIKRPSNLFVSSTSLGMWTNFVWMALSMVSSEFRLPSCRRPCSFVSVFCSSSSSPTSQTAGAACFEGPSCDAEALRAFLSPAGALSPPRFPMSGSRIPARGLKPKWLQTHRR